jgi:hypothetical protein
VLETLNPRTSSSALRILIMLAALGALLVSACRSDDGAAQIDAGQARHFVSDFFTNRADNDILGRVYNTLDEVLPNVEYVRTDGTKGPVATLAVVGRIVSVDKGAGWYAPGDDAASGTQVDFDDNRAEWWAVHARVQVDHAIASEAPEGDLRVHLPSRGPNDFEMFEAGLKALGTVVLFLRNDATVTEYDPELWSVIEEEGVLLATVGANESLELPLMPDRRERELLVGLARLTDLEQKAATPRTIPLVQVNGGWKRTP